MEAVGVDVCGKLKKTRPGRLGVDPGKSREVERGEMVLHDMVAGVVAPGGCAIGFQALKLSPQEQVVAAFGLCTLNPPSVRAST